MPATLFILYHWKKQEKIFLQNLQALRSGHQTDAIHDLRVAVKKLRSYLKLLTIVFKEKDYDSEFETTEQLFSVLGKHRDIEMGLSLLQAFEQENAVAYTPFSNQLKAVLQQTRAWTQNALKDYDEKELTDLTLQLKQDLKETNGQELLVKISAIIATEFKEAKRLANHLDRHPHEVRKLLKNIYYWALLRPENNLLTAEEHKKIKKALDLLGDWQDHEMLLRKTKHFRKDFVPGSKEEYATLKELESQLLEIKEKMLDKAKDAL